MKLILATILAVLVSASAAQCTSVLSIYDPQAPFSYTAPAEAQSVDYVGQIFTVEILASGPAFFSGAGPSDLYGYSLDLTFDPSDLQVLADGVTEQGYFAQNGVSFYDSVDNGAGLISYISDEISGPGPGENLAESGPGLNADELASITFQAVGSGSSTINIPNDGNLYFVDSQGNFTTPITGIDDVTTFPLLGSSAPTPEPGTAGSIAIAGIGLLALARSRPAKRLK